MRAVHLGERETFFSGGISTSKRHLVCGTSTIGEGRGEGTDILWRSFHRATSGDGSLLETERSMHAERSCKRNTRRIVPKGHVCPRALHVRFDAFSTIHIHHQVRRVTQCIKFINREIQASMRRCRGRAGVEFIAHTITLIALATESSFSAFACPYSAFSCNVSDISCSLPSHSCSGNDAKRRCKKIQKVKEAIQGVIWRTRAGFGEDKS